MKKLFISLVSVLLSLFISSCVWIPITDYSKLREKTTYKNFDHLNEPILLKMNIQQDFVLKGSNTNEKSSRSIGTVLAVYDWESNQLFDYVFTKEEIYLHNSGNGNFMQAIKDDKNSTNFFPLSNRCKKINMMYSNKNILDEFEGTDKAVFDGGWTTSHEPVSRYGLLYYWDSFDNNSDYLIKINVFNTVTQTMWSGIEFSANNSNIANNFAIDSEGNYWLSYTRENHKNHKLYTDVRKINVQSYSMDDVFFTFENTAEANYDIYDGWSKINNYDLRYIDDDYLVFIQNSITIGQNETYSITVLDRKTKNVSQINPEINENYWISELVKIDGKLYVLAAYSNGKYNLFELSLENKTAVSLNVELDIPQLSTLEIRDSRLYFICENEEILVSYYDVREKAFHKMPSITINDFKIGE